MRVYVQGASALAHYRTSSAKTDVELCSQSIRSLADATSSRQAIVDAGIWRLGIGEPTPDQPLDVLVRNAGQRCRSQAVRARIWHGDIAATAFRKVSKSIYVSSPEFVYLQMARSLDLPRLAALGMELCGTYRRNVVAFTLGTNSTTYVTEYNQQPLTTPRRLRGFLSTMQSAPGCSKALKALEYVLPNSASPIESALYLLLCLPRRLGGYALPKPILNPSITLTKAGGRHTLRNQAKPDLYWKTKRIDLEYNSDEFHDESSRAIDSMRRKALERMRVEVIELTPDELYSTSLFHETALRIAKRLGKRIRSEDEGNFRAKRANLRQSLLFDDITSGNYGSDFDSGSKDDNAGIRLEATWAIDDSEAVAFISNDTGSWEDEAFDDVWIIDADDFDEGWATELLDLDDDVQLNQDDQMVFGKNDGDLHVFGARGNEDSSA